MNRFLFLFILIALALVSCSKDPQVSVGDTFQLTIPKGFPQPVIPSDNQMTQLRIDLGKKLFHDNILSKDYTVNCSSCHLASYAFCDTAQFSLGVGGKRGKRNAPSLTNALYNKSFFWDGGVASMEQQVMGPIENPLEMNLPLTEAVDRLKASAEYVKLFKQAYDREPDLFGLTRAIACYERTLISGNSAYDRYSSHGETSALTASQVNGMNIFFGEKGECFHCHGEFNFTDESYRNNGLYLVYSDSGRMRITSNTSDIGKFKVPTLRNIELTAPYMHDGSLKTLEDVVEHYNSGGKNHPNKSGVILPLNLTVQEKADLVNFLKSLTDHDFIQKNK